MKKLIILKKSLLASAVALSVLSSSANAVSEEVVKAYWKETLRGKARFPEYLELSDEDLEGLKKFEDSEWEEFKKIVQDLVPSDRNVECQAMVIKALASIPSKILFHKDFITTARVFTANADVWGYSYRISDLGKVPVEILFHKYFITTVQALMADNNLTSVFSGLSRIAPEKLNEFRSIVEIFVKSNMSGSDRAQLIKVFLEIPSETLFHKNFSDTAQSLVPNGLPVTDRVSVVSILGRIAPEKLTEFHSLVQFFHKESNSAYERTMVVKALAGVPSEILFHRNFRGTARAFIPSHMNIGKSVSVIKALGVVPSDTLFHEKFIETAKALAENFVEKDILDQVIVELGKIPSERLFDEKFIKVFQALVKKDSSASDLTQVIKMFNKTSSERLFDEKFIPIARVIAENVKGLRQLSQVIVELGKIPSERLFDEKFIKVFQALVKKDSSASDLTHAIEELASMPSETIFHNDFITTAQAFISSNMDLNDRIEVVKSLASVPSETLFHKDFITTALTFIPGNNVGASNRSHVIRVVGGVAPEKWGRFISILQHFINDHTRLYEATGLIQAVGRINPSRMDFINLQLKRLKDEAQIKFKFKQSCTAEDADLPLASVKLVNRLVKFHTAERAHAYMSILIGLVQQHSDSIDDDGLFACIREASNRLELASLVNPYEVDLQSELPYVRPARSSKDTKGRDKDNEPHSPRGLGSRSSSSGDLND